MMPQVMEYFLKKRSPMLNQEHSLTRMCVDYIDLYHTTYNYEDGDEECLTPKP